MIDSTSLRMGTKSRVGLCRRHTGRMLLVAASAAAVAVSGCGAAAETQSTTDADIRSSLAKRKVAPFHAPSCAKIAKNIKKGVGGYRKRTIKRTTQYYTPLFKAGRDGGLRRSDRRACINVEGSCIVGNWLYNYAGPRRPNGKRYDRKKVAFKFGMGSGTSQYNKTNALDPCRTVAADKSRYPRGTVIFIPSMKGAVCPQTQKAVDGCFVVGDVGQAIKGSGRFDIFTGECSNYRKGNNTCGDPLNRGFRVPKKSKYYVIKRDKKLAKELRKEADQFIQSDWGQL